MPQKNLPTEKIVEATVQSFSLVSDEIYQVFLELQDVPQAHLAGQYLLMKIGEDWSAFSIANQPVSGLTSIELHVRVKPGRTEDAFTRLLKKGAVFSIKYPLGQCVFRPGTEPLLLVAGGTGFSQVKALLEAGLAEQKRPIFFIWLGKETSDFYLDKWLNEIVSQKPPHFSSQQLILDHRQMTVDAFQKQFLSAVNQLSLEPQGALAYLAGSPPMVKVIAAALQNLGFNKHRIKSDVFDLAL